MRFIKNFFGVVLRMFLVAIFIVVIFYMLGWAVSSHASLSADNHDDGWQEGSMAMCLYITSSLNGGGPETKEEALAWVTICDEHTDFIFERDPVDWFGPGPDGFIYPSFDGA